MSDKIRLLLIDDEQDMLELLYYHLGLFGFEVFTASDGPSGLKLAQNEKFDLILLDWMMPGMNGLEVLSELKHNKKTEEIPVFMFTAKGIVEDIDQAFDIGADDYIVKPIEGDELAKRLKAKLAKYEAKKRAQKPV
jgi:two-component system alkaline phosphatase synthesis response regulator PhoP